MILWINNRAKVIAEAVGTYSLWLPSRFRLDLKDCYFIPVASQNLIFMSMLAQDGFDFDFNKDIYFIYLWNKFIIHGLLIENLYHLYIDVNINLNQQIVSAIS